MTSRKALSEPCQVSMTDNKYRKALSVYESVSVVLIIIHIG